MVEKDSPFTPLEVPEVYLAQNNKDIIGCLSSVNNLNVELKLNDVNTISFTMYQKTDGLVNPYYEELTELKLSFLQKYGWFKLNVKRVPLGNNEYKEVAGKSLEVELQQINLSNLEINSGDMDYEEYEDSKPITFYNAADPEHSLLHIVLQSAPSWTIGHVDEALTIKQRSFDVECVDIYSFLTRDVAQTVQCFFVFDSFLRTVNAYVVDDYGMDTNIFCDASNLLQSASIDVDDSQIKTMFRVYGGENLQIEEVNPVGNNILINVDYYLKYMTNETRAAYLSYVNTLKGKTEEFSKTLAQIQEMVMKRYDLLQRQPKSSNSLVWTEYGLNKLKMSESSYLGLETEFIGKGYGTVTSSEYTTQYLPNHNLLTAVRSEIKVREGEIKTLDEEEAVLVKKNAEIAKSLNLEQFFTPTQWKEFQLYLREDRYENTNLHTTSLECDTERIKTAQELMEAAKKALDKISKPNYTITTTLSNLLSIPEFQPITESFRLGNFIRLGINEQTVIKLRLITIGLDFSDFATIYVEFSDMLRVNSLLDDTASILNQACGAANSVNHNYEFWKKGGDQGNWVWEMRKNGLDVAQVAITSAKNQNQLMDEFGMLFRLWNEEKLDYEQEQAKLINNLFAFTDDSWKSVKLALGKIHILNPNSGVESDCYGLIADALVGKMMLSESTYIGNSNNTFTIDELGLFAYSKDKNTVVKIDPNNNSGLLEIWKDYQKDKKYKTLWTDDTGNLNIIGIFSANELQGGKIVAQKGNNKVMIDPSSENGLFQVWNGDKLQIYFNKDGDAVFEGKMTIGAIYSKNWISSGGSATGYPKGKQGTFINLYDGTFTFCNDRLMLDQTGLTSKDPNDKDLFTKIAGAQLESRGKYTLGWMNDASIIGKLTHTTIQNGRIELKNDDNSRDLFILSEGISTTVDAGDGSTGLIDFYSKVYGNELFGLTVQTSSSPVALRSMHGCAIINPHVNNAKGNMFMFVIDDTSDGILHFGSYNPWLSKTSMRFSSSENKVQVQNLNATGSITVNNVEVAIKTEVDELKKKIDDLIYDRNKWKADAQSMHAAWDGHSCPTCNRQHV